MKKKIYPQADLSDFKDSFRGEKCFIIGSGTSLHGLDLSRIHDHVVIAVNSSALLMPWKSGDYSKRFWISNDTLCLRWSYFWSHVAETNCTKLIRVSWRKYQDEWSKFNRFRLFDTRVSQKSPLSQEDKGLCYVSSVPSALDFSLRLGCSKIYLVGVDHKIQKGNSHFWQLWPKEKWPKRIDKKIRHHKPHQAQQLQMFKQNVPVFKALKDLSLLLGSEVYNCSSISALNPLFPSTSIEQALK